MTVIRGARGTPAPPRPQGAPRVDHYTLAVQGLHQPAAGPPEPLRAEPCELALKWRRSEGFFSLPPTERAVDAKISPDRVVLFSLWP